MSDVRYSGRKSLLGRALDLLLVTVFREVNKTVSWDKLWPPLGLANLLALRVELRRDNLHDTDGDLTQPKSDDSAAFVTDDLVHPVVLFKKLQAQADPVSAMVWSRVSDGRKALLKKLCGDSAEALEAEHRKIVSRRDVERLEIAALQRLSVLARELNKVIQGGPIYDREVFRHVTLSAETAGLMDQNPRGEDLEWLNRWLLEDAYPLELRRNRERKRACPFHSGPNATRQRTEDGTMNDLRYPTMGCRFSRLGRNMRSRRPVDTEPGLLHPNPLLISDRLLKRGGKFQPATTLNLLAGAWIQFQVHDWFGHENEHQEAGKDIRVPKAGSWPPTNGDAAPFVDPRGDMVVPRTKSDPGNASPLNGRCPAFRNKDPQWWDGSQVYGESVEETLRLRTNPATWELCPHGMLHIDEHGLLPRDENGHVLSGFTDNWWLGTEILHTLFAREHNAICRKLREAEPHLGDQEIFETARLINCAIMAKIHTIEWTPGILAHPAIQPALNANWMGLIGHFVDEKTARTVAHWLPDGVLKDLLTGIPMSEPDHHGAPYALTEEFNAVYRLHPLLPDEVPLRSVGDREPLALYPTQEIAFEKARTPLDDGFGMADLVYSFGVTHPGAITIQNYPDFLRELKLPADPENGRTKVQMLDLGAVDILRDRERGVPRYNEFRRQLRMKPAESWQELAGSRPDLAGVLEEVYEGDLEAVDNMVGMFCERNPEGFGFSDTAFRVFILMASRRLKSDRFFTSDYTEECYTRTGLDWIAETGMRQVIERHFPELAGAIAPGQNPFAPWNGRPVGGNRRQGADAEASAQ